MKKYGLTDIELKLLMKLCVDPLQKLNAKVWIFGSRARGDYTKSSDIDLLYEVENNLGLSVIGKIESDLEESRLPYKVDLVDLNHLASSYREGVFREQILLN